jgi:hypothetical protein
MTAVALAHVSHCPYCGRPTRRPGHTRPPVEPASPVDTHRLSDTEVFQHFKRMAPVEDLHFFLRHARLSPDLRADGDALLAVGCRETGGALSRSDWYRRLTALQDRWRRETAAVPIQEVSELMTEAV